MADVTQLDRLGIPVYQAIRPASLNLSVSQGKGITREDARVSAVMESMELWHAERLDHLPQVQESLREMNRNNSIDSETLPWRKDCYVFDALPIPWIQVHSLVSDRTGWLPRSMIELDFTLPQVLRPRMFHVNSNGLASGNTQDEALIHSLCELIERHALFNLYQRKVEPVPIDPDSVEGPDCRDLINRIRQADMKLCLKDMTWEIGLPCILAEIVGPDLPKIWQGSGCHPSPEIAVSRALTEAAQSRLTFISGARDDLLHHRDRIDFKTYDNYEEPQHGCRLDELRDISSNRLETDLAKILDSLGHLNYEPYAVDLTRKDIGIPVVRAFVPGLRMPLHG